MKGRSLSEVLSYAQKHFPKSIKHVVVYPHRKGYILRYLPKKVSDPKTKKQILNRIIFAVASSEWRKKTTKYARDGFELNAKWLGTRLKQERIDMVSSDGIIRKRNVIMSGFNLYIRSIMLRASIGLPPVYKSYRTGTPKPMAPEIISAELTPDDEAIELEIEQFVRKSDDFDIIRIKLFDAVQYVIKNERLLAVLDLPREKRVIGKNILHIRIDHIPGGGNIWGNKDIPLTHFSGGKIFFKAETVAVEEFDTGAIASSPSNKVEVKLPKRELRRSGVLLRKRLQDYSRKLCKRVIARKIKDGSIKEYLKAKRESNLRYYYKNNEKFSVYHRRYYLKNRGKITAYNKKYRKKSWKRFLANQRGRYWENHNEKLKYQRAYYYKNHEGVLKYQRRYYIRNHKKILERKRKYITKGYYREYYKKNREKILQSQKRYYLKNREPR